MTEPTEEYHEHPGFNGQWHWAVWVRTWVSNGTNNHCPEGALITCAICGKPYSQSGR